MARTICRSSCSELPLVRPGHSTLAVLSFLTNWNDLMPIYVLFSPGRFTLPPGLSIHKSAYTPIPW